MAVRETTSRNAPRTKGGPIKDAATQLRDDRGMSSAVYRSLRQAGAESAALLKSDKPKARSSPTLRTLRTPGGTKSV